MSYHFVVIMTVIFHEKYSHLNVFFHLTSSDSYEMFFYKMGGMVGMERTYDFQELVNCANSLNHFFAIEYGKNGNWFLCGHITKCVVYGQKLHPLQDGEPILNLGD